MSKADDIEKQVLKILKEDERRMVENNAPFDPVSGVGSIGERVLFELPDFPIATQWLPVEMMDEPLVKKLQKAGSVKKFIRDYMHMPHMKECVDKVVEKFVRIRIRYDFAFWAATFVYIKRKGGGTDMLFRLNRPQRRLVERFEEKRKAGKPIRLIILKARQWGGSTCTQLYMAWLQLVHMQGLNSLIIAHQTAGSDEINDMFKRMIDNYPVELLHEMGDVYSENEPKYVGVGVSGIIHRVPQRNFKIKIGTAIHPKTCLGGDYNLVHMSETAKWRETEGTKPEEVVANATAGIPLIGNTMIVMESTADGVGNYFHKEYTAAKDGKSQFDYIFVPWFEIELYEMAFESEQKRKAFARWLYENRNRAVVESNREEPGSYLWYLWGLGATLEGIHWYVEERMKFSSHGDMAYMYPSDDIEAFTFSGRRVFANDDIEALRSGCKEPRWRGEIYGNADDGEAALEGLRFKKENDGRLLMWHDAERDDEETRVLNRYLVVVDVCKGMTKNADYADILVLDRLNMIDGGLPVVAAEWHGHIEMDRLAWKAAQVAAYYNNALLVIESNTLETNQNQKTNGEAIYILSLIADVYDNLYTRRQSAEDIRQGRPKKYGFHTNVLTKKVIILNLQMVLREKMYIERERACLDEYATYIESEDGVFEAMEGHHDDRLMTRAIGLYVCYKEMDLPEIIEASRRRSTNAPKQLVTEATL